MPYYRSRRRTRTHRRKGSKWTSRSRSRRSKVSTTVKKYVKRELHKNVENKYQDIQATEIAIDYQIDNTDVFNLLPRISQGINQETRIGNSIRCVKLKLTVHITCFNQGSTTSPTYFDIYIFKYKPANFGGGAPSAADMLGFLQDGSSSKPYVANALDGMRMLNSDRFTYVTKRRVQLFNPLNATTQVSVNAGRPSVTMKFDLTKHVKKILKFDDNNTACQNDNLYIAIGGTQTDDTLLTSVNLAKYDFLVEMSYEDA